MSAVKGLGGGTMGVLGALFGLCLLAVPGFALAQTDNPQPSKLLGNGISLDSTASSSDSLSIAPLIQRSQYGTYEQALVNRVEERFYKTASGLQKGYAYRLDILSGLQKGSQQSVMADPISLPQGFKPQNGDKVIVFAQADPTQNQPVFFLVGYDRQNMYIWILIMMIIGSLLLGGWKGLKTVFGLVLAIFLIIKISIPLYLAAWPAMLIMAILLLVFAGINSLLVTSWRKDALIATLGTVGSGLAAFLLASWLMAWTHLQGLDVLLAQNLFKENPQLDAGNLILLGAGIVALGLIHDLAAYLAMSIGEIKQQTPAFGFKDLFRSGMQLGRSRLATLAPIMGLIYIGAFLPALLPSFLAGYPLNILISQDSLAHAILLPFISFLGLMLTIPICSLFGALAWTRNLRGTDPLRRATSWRQKNNADSDQTSLPL